MLKKGNSILDYTMSNGKIQNGQVSIVVDSAISLSPTVIKKLANGINNFNLSNLPDDIKNIAKNCLIDIFGVTFAGSSTYSSKLIQNFSEKNYNSGKWDCAWVSSCFPGCFSCSSRTK